MKKTKHEHIKMNARGFNHMMERKQKEDQKGCLIGFIVGLVLVGIYIFDEGLGIKDGAMVIGFLAIVFAIVGSHFT